MKEFIKQCPDVVYHGTVSKHLESLKKGINIDVSNEKTDFGKGFYTTFNYEQAKTFAIQKAKEHNNSEKDIKEKKNNYECSYVYPVVVEYKLDKKRLSGLESEYFKTSNDKWAEFVYNNRIGSNSVKSDYHNYDKKFDFVYGDVADTRLFPTIKKYKQGKINWDQFVKGISPYKYVNEKYNQLSVHTQCGINCLKYKKARLEVMK